MRQPCVVLLLGLTACTAIDDFGQFGFGDGGGADLVAENSRDLREPTPDLGNLLVGPTAKINHPASGQTRSVATPVPFIGQASDPMDGPLTGGSLVWTSSIDGQIGTGTTFSATLTAGMHTITLTASDSRGLMGTDSIALTMQ